MGPWTRRTVFSGRRATGTLDWAEDQLGRRGGVIIVVARFVPGGRTATTFEPAFEHQTWKALLLAFGIALVGTAAIEGVRR